VNLFGRLRDKKESPPAPAISVLVVAYMMKRYVGQRRVFGLESADWSLLFAGVAIAGLLVLVM
jgi:hypothetical protein